MYDNGIVIMILFFKETNPPKKKQPPLQPKPQWDVTTHDRMAITNKTTNNTRWQEYGEKGIIVHCWWDCVLVQPPRKTKRKK